MSAYHNEYTQDQPECPFRRALAGDVFFLFERARELNALCQKPEADPRDIARALQALDQAYRLVDKLAEEMETRGLGDECPDF